MENAYRLTSLQSEVSVCLMALPLYLALLDERSEEEMAGRKEEIVGREGGTGDQLHATTSQESKPFIADMAKFSTKLMAMINCCV